MRNRLILALADANDVATSFAIRHDWWWLFNLTGAVEYWVDCQWWKYNDQPSNHTNPER